MAKRTDPHRPGAIVPAEYEPVFSYNTPSSANGMRLPSYRVNCELDRRTYDADGRLLANGQHDADGRCCIVGLRQIARVKFAATGATGQCSVCGAHYVYGDVWRHVPTDEYLHVGHDCADKYELLFDRSRDELERDRLRAAAAVAITREMHREQREQFLAAHPGLREVLTANHPILRDMSDKLTRYGSLSDKQIAFATKLANEVQHPAPVEVHAVAPTGKNVVVRGRVVSVKAHESMFGTVNKMTVKVTTPAGTWLAWTTVPTNLEGTGSIRGAEVEFVADLEAGKDAHFVFGKRPRKARVLVARETVEAQIERERTMRWPEGVTTANFDEMADWQHRRLTELSRERMAAL